MGEHGLTRTNTDGEWDYAAQVVAGVVLIGPTGAGKSPLGDYLERIGLCGRRCMHFDFGAALRRAGSQEAGVGPLSKSELRVVQRVLATGALLEDDEFHIALKLLRGHLRNHAEDDIARVILNGLPRHVGQARDLMPILRVHQVVNLRCSHAVTHQRISGNEGGDRTDRVDDSPEEVENKLRLFDARTLALLEHYENMGVLITSIDISVNTQPEDIVRQLEELQPAET